MEKKISKLEENLRRIKIIQSLGDFGVCGEYKEIVNDCSVYASDCPQTCTYAKNKNKENDESSSKTPKKSQ